MSILQTRALVLRSYPYGESSLVLHFFTEKYGKVAVLAKGARQLKSPLRGYLEPFSLLEIIFYAKPTRELQLLSKAEKLACWGTLARDWEDTLFGSVVLEVIDKLTTPQPDEPLFDLAQTALAYMDNHPQQLAAALLKFLLQTAEISGYRLNLDSCAVCRQPLLQAFYDQIRAGLVCPACRPLNGESIFLSEGTARQLRELQQCAWDSLPPLHTFTDTDFQLARMLVHYLGFQHDLTLKLKSLELLRKSAAQLSGESK